jgi:hypothetical protein
MTLSSAVSSVDARAAVVTESINVDPPVSAPMASVRLAIDGRRTDPCMSKLTYAIVCSKGTTGSVV